MPSKDIHAALQDDDARGEGRERAQVDLVALAGAAGGGGDREGHARVEDAGDAASQGAGPRQPGGSEARLAQPHAVQAHHGVRGDACVAIVSI
eukprot:6516822-Lingulodinium_polyedra.AAC.1